MLHVIKFQRLKELSLELKTLLSKNTNYSKSVNSLNEKSSDEFTVMLVNEVTLSNQVSIKQCNTNGCKKDGQVKNIVTCSTNNTYSCKICGGIFKLLSTYNKHITSNDTCTKMNTKKMKNSDVSSDDYYVQCDSSRKAVEFNCLDCDKKFNSKVGLAAHLRVHSGVKPFTCHLCGKQLSHPASLNYHLKHVHLKVKNHRCDICGRCFAMKSFKEDHQRTHTGERPFICDVCGKTFKSKASLYIHSKTHTNNFPFPCKLCDRKFRWCQQLERHSHIHTGEKNHTCDTCGKQFGVKNHLTRHKLVHTNSKPLKCSFCSSQFTQKRYLQSHVKLRHHMVSSETLLHNKVSEESSNT